MQTRLPAHLSAVALGAALALASSAASAGLVTSTFQGTVAEIPFGPAQIHGDFPIGTPVSWSFTFDDAFADLNAFQGGVLAAAQQPITGWLQVGAYSMALDQVLGLYDYRFDAGGAVLNYVLRVAGTGPNTPGGGDSGELAIARNDQVIGPFGPLLGLRYTNGGGARFSTARLDGTVSFNDVPEPASSALLLAGMLATAAGVRRRKIPPRPR